MAVNKKYLSLEEAAVQLGVNPEELVRLREKGEIRGFQDGRSWKFKAEDIAEYHRSTQADSDPDLPMISDLEMFDDPPPRKKSPGDMQSDSDVRLAHFDAPRKSQLTGSSAELPALSASDSDSDVRLVDAPSSSKPSSDSDVKMVKPKGGKNADSDSDVKMISAGLSDPDSDSDVKMVDDGSSDMDSESDVKLLDPGSRRIDSDSDVRMASSDSDVRLADRIGGTADQPSSDSDVKYAPLSESDSDVKIAADPLLSKPDSDSDVMLLSKSKRGSAPGGSGLQSGKKRSAQDTEDLEIDLGGSTGPGSSGIRPADSGIPLSGDSGFNLAGDSGIKLSGDSGIQLAGDSGIRLAGDSGIRLDADSGIRLSEGSGLQLMKPADSGISLEGPDSGIQFADSGLNLASPSSGNLGGKSRKGGSSRKLKGASGSVDDDIEATSPMLSSDLEDVDLEASNLLADDGATNELNSLDFDDININDTSEMQSLADSGQSVVLFDDDEEVEQFATKKKKGQKASDEDLLDMDDSAEAELEELEAGDDDLSGETDFDDMAFDSGSEELDDRFGGGSSEDSVPASRKLTPAVSAEWSTGVLLLLMASLGLSIFGVLISADLLRTVWAFSQEATVDQGIAWLPAKLWQ